MKIPTIITSAASWLTSNSAIKFLVSILVSSGIATFWVETNTRTEMKVQIEKEIVTGQIKIYNHIKSIEGMNMLAEVEHTKVVPVTIYLDQFGNEIKDKTINHENYYSNDIVYTPSFCVNYRDNQRILSLLNKIEHDLDNLDHDAYIKVQQLLNFIDQNPIKNLKEDTAINNCWTQESVYNQFFNIVKQTNIFFEERYGKFIK